MHANGSNQKIFKFVKEREKFDRWNPWAMGSSGGMLRDFVLEIFGVCGRLCQASPTTSPNMRTYKELRKLARNH